MKKLIFLLLLFLTFRSIGQNHYVVTLTSDPGNPFFPVKGQLRWAIEQANKNPGLDYIDFNIPSQAPRTIQLRSDLPAITSPVIIDGSTQPANGYTGIEPKINIKGNKNDPRINGAFFIIPSGRGTIIKNMTLYDYYSQTVVIGNSSGNLIQNCVFYESGSTQGSFLAISDNSDNNQVKGNYFGTNRGNTVSPAISRKATAMVITGLRPDNNIIGGGNDIDRNYFYNAGDGPSSGAIDIHTGNGNKVVNNIFINNKPKNIDIYSNDRCRGNICKRPPVYQASTSIVQGTSLANDLIEVYLSNSTGIDAVRLLGTATANSSGQWSLNVTGVNATDKIIATATDRNNNTSEFGPPFTVPSPCPTCRVVDFTFPEICEDNPVTFTNTSSVCSGNPIFTWNFGDGSPVSEDPEHTYTTPGTYTVTLILTSSAGCSGKTSSKQITVVDCTPPPPCENCIGSFAPEAGDYILSAWVKEEGAVPTTLTYTRPQIFVEFPNLGSAFTLGPFTAQGAIIDGWQRVEAKFAIPSNATYINLQLKSVTGNSFFDDIRIFPFNGSMKSYVYDPVNLRLVAELDERNYATMYEYDEEGKLIRVKKETEKGVMTIKANQNSTKKK
ncbi:MAG: PKD domain-containing protein [Bacteroidota bacterium]